MANGKSNFGNDELGVGSDDGGAEDVTGAFGEEFDETIIKTMDSASGDVTEGDEGASIFMTFFDETRFR